jgi:hypothetical protein
LTLEIADAGGYPGSLPGNGLNIRKVFFKKCDNYLEKCRGPEIVMCFPGVLNDALMKL